MSSLVKVTDLEWRGDDVRRRQRWWIFQKGLSIRITRVVAASVIFSNSNDHASGRKGWDSACERRGRGGYRFPFDWLNLGSRRVLTG